MPVDQPPPPPAQQDHRLKLSGFDMAAPGVGSSMMMQSPRLTPGTTSLFGSISADTRITPKATIAHITNHSFFRIYPPCSVGDAASIPRARRCGGRGGRQ